MELFLVFKGLNYRQHVFLEPFDFQGILGLDHLVTQPSSMELESQAPELLTQMELRFDCLIGENFVCSLPTGSSMETIEP